MSRSRCKDSGDCAANKCIIIVQDSSSRHPARRQHQTRAKGQRGEAHRGKEEARKRQGRGKAEAGDETLRSDSRDVASRLLRSDAIAIPSSLTCLPFTYSWLQEESKTPSFFSCYHTVRASRKAPLNQGKSSLVSQLCTRISELVLCKFAQLKRTVNSSCSFVQYQRFLGVFRQKETCPPKSLSEGPFGTYLWILQKKKLVYVARGARYTTGTVYTQYTIVADSVCTWY